MKTKNLVLFLLAFSLTSCDPTFFRISIDGGAFEKKISFDCGSIVFHGTVLADRQINATLKFNLDYPVLLNPEKLEITHKEEFLTATRISLYERRRGGAWGVRMQEERMISGNTEIGIVIDRTVHAGDTMKINIDNFILCKENPLEIGDINLIFITR